MIRAIASIAIAAIVVQVCNVNAQCDDIAPSSSASCSQQKQWGKCSSYWMTSGGFCRTTCGKCSSSNSVAVCTDIPPNPQYTCLQQKSYGACNAGWIISGNYCATTCGRCIPPPALCSDVPDTPSVSCWQRLQWKQCNEYWMTAYNYCAQVCRPPSIMLPPSIYIYAISSQPSSTVLLLPSAIYRQSCFDRPFQQTRWDCTMARCHLFYYHTTKLSLLWSFPRNASACIHILLVSCLDSIVASVAHPSNIQIYYLCGMAPICNLASNTTFDTCV